MEIPVLNFRYFAAVGVSLAIHTALIWSVPEKKAFAMPVGSQSSQVNIQFVAPSSPSIPSEKKVVAEKAKVKPTQPEKTVTKKISDVKKPTKTHKPKPTIKEKSITKAPVKTEKQKTAKVKPNEPLKKTKTINKKKVTKADSAAKPVASRAGATEKPQLIKKPSFLKRPSAPRYPRIAQRKGIEGTALYEIWLNENGKQVKQQLITSSGASVLDEAALNAIRDWKFSPQVINGQAIAHRVQIPVRFSLN